MKFFGHKKRENKAKVVVYDVQLASPHRRIVSLRQRIWIFTFKLNLSKIWKLIIRRRLAFGVTLLILLISAGLLNNYLTSRAELAIYYPSSTLGNWKYPENARGEPELGKNAKREKFTEENSAVLDNKKGELYVGNFEGEIPDNSRPEDFFLSFIWNINSRTTDKNILDISYTLNNSDWRELGKVNSGDWQGAGSVFQIPLNKWDDLSKVQIAIKTTSDFEDGTKVYLDGVTLGVEYKKISDRKFLSQKELDKFTKKEVPAEKIFTSSKKNWEADESPEFEIKIPGKKGFDPASDETSANTDSADQETENDPVPDSNQTGNTTPPSDNADSNDSAAPDEISPDVGNQNNLPDKSQELSATTKVPFSDAMKKILRIEKAEADTADLARTILVNPRGEEMNIVPEIIDTAQGVKVTLPSLGNSFRPGKYTLTAEILDGDTVLTSTQDFTWGVLALNTNKSIYAPGEKADIAMAVLNEYGNMVCNADVVLKIKNDKLGIDDELSTENGKITVDEQCYTKAFSLTPDYKAEYDFGDEGTYFLDLSATTDNGTYSISDKVEVRAYVPFDVERISATRIYPTLDYPVTFSVNANQDFKGTVQEVVPDSFTIVKGEGDYKTYDHEKTEGDEKIITWDIDVKKGDKFSLGYQFQAPHISPEFYLLGPLRFIGKRTISLLGDKTVFEEARQWQIAADATQQYTTGSGNWNSPVTANVSVELHGGGGGGGRGGGTNKYGGGGGAGGQAVVNSSVAVTKGTNYAYSVGAAGAGGNSGHVDGYVGSDTTLAINGTTYTAKGGDYGRGNASGAAGGTGSTTGGVAGAGGTVYKGGNGYQGSNGSGSGSGGGGAGSTADGANATGYTSPGGTTANNGGNGGLGNTSNAAAGAAPTTAYGGGGGGGTKNSDGGAGYAGYILITYPDNTAPTAVMDTNEGASFSTGTPSLLFTGTDATYADDITYELQIDTSTSFNSQGGSPLLDKLSASDPGGAFTRGGDSDPFTSGQQVTFTVESADSLSSNTYYWRIRGKDPSGTNTWGDWATYLGSGYKSFTVTVAYTVSGNIYQSGSDSNLDTTAYTIAVSANNGSPTTNTANGDGTYSVTLGTPPSSGQSVAVYIQNNANDANTFTVTDGNAMSSINLYVGKVAIGSNNGATATGNSNICNQANYPSASSPDDRLLSCPSGNNITVESGAEVHILTTKKYDTGSSATLTTQGTGGAFHVDDSAQATFSSAGTISGAVAIDASATLTVGTTNTLSVGGNWTNSGTFTANSSTVTFNGSAQQTVSGTLNGTSAFYNLTITNSSGASASDDERTGFTASVAFGNADMTVSNNYTITTSDVRVEYYTGKTYTFTNINWIGTASHLIYFRNSATSGTWLMKVTGLQSVSYVNVSRSDASVSGSNGVFCGDGTNHDGSNNTYWYFTNTRVRQEVNILTSNYSASGDSNERVYIDPAKYAGTMTYKFEIVAKVTSGTGTVTVHDAANNVHATISVADTSYTKYTEVFSTAPTVDTYHINLSGGTGLTVQAARVIILQDTGSSTLSKTETQVEIGDSETKTNTSSAPLDYPKYWLYTAANWDGTKTFYAEAAYKVVTSGSVTVTLEKDTAGDLTNWSSVVTIVNAQTQTSPTLSSRVSFTPVDGCNYRIAAYITANSYSIYNAKIVVDQEGGGSVSGSIADGSTYTYDMDTTTADSPTNIFDVIESAPRDMAFNDDGTIMYFVSDTTNKVYQADLSTAWAMSSTSTTSGSYTLSYDGMNGLFFNSDGTKFFVLEDNSGGTQSINVYNLGTAWDVTSVSSTQEQTLTTEASEVAVRDMYFNSDGKKLYVIGDTNDDVYYYTLSTGWDITTISYVGYYNFSTQTTAANGGLAFSPDGKKMFISGTSDNVFQYSLTTAWTITSGVSYDNAYFDMSVDGGVTGETDIRGLLFSSDMTKVYIAGSSLDDWCQFPSGLSYSTSNITVSEPQYLLQDTYKNTTGLQDYDTTWNTLDWQGVANTYYHEINSSSDTADEAKLQYYNSGSWTDVTNSSATGTAYRKRTTSLTMPSSDTLDTNITNVPIYASRIIVQLQIPSPPTVTSPTITSVAIPTATMGANVTSNGGATLTARGTCWGTSAAPTTNCVAEGGTGTGVFTHSRSSITENVTIYYRGYATNVKGTSYSADGVLSRKPNAGVQYKNDHETVISTGGSTADGVSNNDYLDFSVPVPDTTETITPKVEVRDTGTAFTGSSTATGDAISANPDVPEFRTYPTIIYDSSNDRMILFGGKERIYNATTGCDITTYFNDVWEMKLPTADNPNPVWNELSPTGTPPSVRNAALAVYDSTYQRMIVYGGLYNTTDYNDFYYLTLPSDSDGAWSSFTPSGNTTTTRWASAGVYDTQRATPRLVFYGGNHYSTNTDLSDLWSVTLPQDLSGTNSAATQLSPTGTPTNAARSEHTAILDTATSPDRMVIFAGWSGSARVNSTIAVTLPTSGDGAWSTLTSSGAPSIRSGQAAIFDSTNDRMITFMGCNHSTNGVCGTTNTTYYNDIYQLSLVSGSEAWSQKDSTTDGQVAGGRHALSAIYDSGNQRAVTFGGVGITSYPYNEPLVIDLPSSGTLYYNELSPLVNLMAGDASASVYDSYNKQMVRFGGFNRIYNTSYPEDTGYHINETWTYGVDGTSANYNALNNISPSVGPLAREGPSVVYDSTNKRLIMFGGLGYNQDDSFNDTWAMSLDPSSSDYKKWTRLSPTGTPPSKRWGAAATFDSTNNRMILFGGALKSIKANATMYNDVFALSLGTPGSEAWSSSGSGLTISGTGPTYGQFQSTAIYDPGNTRVLIFGGVDGQATQTFYNKLWELDWTSDPTSLTWTDRTPTYSPSLAGRRGQVTVYQGDYTEKRMIMFGGWDGTNHYNDVWKFDISSLTVTASNITPSGTAPVVRRSSNTIYDPNYGSGVNLGRMIIQGGRGSSSPVNFLNDFWQLTLNESTSSWTWSQLSPDTYLKASVPVTSLTASTDYHWQAWSTGSVTGDSQKYAYGGNSDTVTAATDFTVQGVPVVSTQSPSNVLGTSATGNGNITNTGGLTVTRRGFCYMTGTSGDPTTANSVAYDDGSFTTGAYTKSITGLSAGTNYRVRAYAVNSSGTGYGTTVQMTTNSVPTISPNTADAYPFGTDTTPTLEFTGSDADSDHLRYNIQIDNNSDCLSPILDKVSGTDNGFVNTENGSDPEPYTAGQKISYTVQAGDALSTGTYYWRARAKDPNSPGTNTYSDWTTIRSFTIDTGGQPLSLSCVSSVAMTDYTLGNSNNYNQDTFSVANQCTVTDNSSSAWSLTIQSSNMISTNNTIPNTSIYLVKDGTLATEGTITTGSTPNISETIGTQSLDAPKTIIQGTVDASGTSYNRPTIKLDQLNSLHNESTSGTVTITLS